MWSYWLCDSLTGEKLAPLASDNDASDNDGGEQ